MECLLLKSSGAESLKPTHSILLLQEAGQVNPVQYLILSVFIYPEIPVTVSYTHLTLPTILLV